MMHLTRRTLIQASALATCAATFGTARSASDAAEAPAFPFPRRLEYAAGTIRPNHRTRDEQDDDVRAAYDRWKDRYCVVAGTGDDGKGRYRIAFGKPDTENYPITVSEGQGYGMVIVAHMAGHDPEARTIFDGLWRFVRDNPSSIDNRLMNWHVPADADGSDSAFDGDCDIAYALLLADAQWGRTGDIDYRAEAADVLDGIFTSTIGPRSHLPMLGDWVDPNGDPYNQDTTRPSDYMLGHFRAFGRAIRDSEWPRVVTACHNAIEHLQTIFSPDPGLLPDFVEPVSATDRAPRPASPDFLEGPNDGAYGYNAGRTPWRIGTDALLSGNEASLVQIRRIATWSAATFGGNPEAIRAGYTLDGDPLPGSDYFTTFFVAPFGVAAMSLLDGQDWLNALYDAVRDQSEDYYEDSVTLLCLLVMTGNFWDPTG